jgi:hypothetical protein
MKTQKFLTVIFLLEVYLFMSLMMVIVIDRQILKYRHLQSSTRSGPRKKVLSNLPVSVFFCFQLLRL